MFLTRGLKGNGNAIRKLKEWEKNGKCESEESGLQVRAPNEIELVEENLDRFRIDQTISQKFKNTNFARQFEKFASIKTS